MNKNVVIAKENLQLFSHTWTKGLDYEVIDKGDYLTVASNEGQCNFTGKARERLDEMFDFSDNMLVK